MQIITGIHHVTALAKDPRENHVFYTDVLGQRMVKKGYYTHRVTDMAQ